MTGFQVIVIILTALSLLSGIVTVYVSMRISVAKIEVEIQHIKKDIVDNKNEREITMLHFEKNNREDHFEILRKIDKLINYGK
jgi:hypothetical protein